MNRRFVACVAALALLYAGVAWLRRGEPLGLDQGLFACFARWVPRGWLPYRDLYDSKPPLFLYSWVLTRLFPGEIAQQAWWLEGLWLTAAMALAYAVATRLGGRWAGLAAAALLLLGEWAPGWGGFWARAQADEFLALPLLAAALLALRGNAFWAGVLTGVAGLFKIPSLAVAAAWPFLWPKKTHWMVLGMLLPWAMAAGWFAAHGALGDFYQAVFVYHRHNAEYIAPPWTGVVRQFVADLAVNAPLLLVLAVVGARRDRRLIPWIVLTLAAVMLQRQLAGYQFLLAIPALAVAGGVGAAALWPRKLWLAAPLVALVAWQWRAYGERNYDRGIFSPSVEADAAAWIAQRTGPSDGILVWGMAPGVYALADRHPVTRYPFHKILMTEAPLSRMIPGLAERRAELMERMSKDPPLYVLVGRRDRNGFEPEDSFTSLKRWVELYDLLQRDYSLQTEIGRFIVLGRR